jgi:pimeloyl-ACP methyl ester carboxylesterase
MVDVGRRRVHLNCLGAGSPAVVIVGAGFSFDWALVQPGVAMFTEVCTYDAAGTAWSDPGPGPACRDRVPEIRQVLQNAGIEGPYVLAGLSIGALVARWYASRYPREVAGIVLIDHPFVESAANSPAAAPSIPPGLDTPPVLLSQTPIQMAEDESDFQSLPPEARELHRWAASLPRVRPTLETAEECLAEIEVRTGRDPSPLGSAPLAVVSTGNQNLSYLDLQAKLLALSRDSRQVIASRSGHSIEWDQPEAVVDAIRQVVQSVRRAVR